MKKRILNAITGIAALFVLGTASAQCPTITCPSDVTVSVDPGTCDAVVNYTTPVGQDLCSSGGIANILFVSDNAGGTEIPAVLSAAGHNVTSVYNDYNLGDNTSLQGSLSAYDIVYWHAVGAGGYGDVHNAATFTNLSTYVNSGGAVYVTGYDVIASPTDPELIAFLGGASSWDVMGGVTAINGPANSLTDGVTNIVGLTLNNSADHDGLDGLFAGVAGIVQNGTGGWEWTLRTYGLGQIAWVSSGQYGVDPFVQWSTPGTGYHESLLNFAYNHSCTSGSILVVSDYLNGAPEIAPLLIAQGYNVVEVTNDYLSGDNPTLQGSLSPYNLIIWHAIGGSGYGDVHNAATFTNLTNFVNGGGAVMVHGYDVIASPTDPELIAFLGGTSSVDVPGNGGLGVIAGPANSLTDGVSNIVGLTLNNSGDHDALVSLTAGTVGVAPNASGWDWSLRTLGGGEIAWVSTGQNTVAFPQWNTPGSGYYEALLNFAYHHGGCVVNSPITSLIAGLPSGSSFPIGTTTVTYEVTDYQGNNPQSCSFLVTVIDDEAPVLDNPSLGDLVSCEPVTPTIPTATDNCDLSLAGVADVSFPITANGLTVVTWTYTDASGNSSSQTQNVTVTVISNGVSQLGATLTAEVQLGTASYQWLDCNDSYTPIAGEVNDSFTATQTGDYAVEITYNGCVDTSACYLVDLTSIELLNLENTAVYPNPNNGEFTVQSSSLLNGIIITDASGKILFETKEITGAATSIKMNTIQKGLYFVKLIANESSVVHPVVIH